MYLLLLISIKCQDNLHFDIEIIQFPLPKAHLAAKAEIWFFDDRLLLYPRNNKVKSRKL